MRAVNSIAASASPSLLFIAGTHDDIEVHAVASGKRSD
jgi:hypothetical protein